LAALQGIKSGDQGNFRPEQGNHYSRLLEPDFRANKARLADAAYNCETASAQHSPSWGHRDHDLDENISVHREQRAAAQMPEVGPKPISSSRPATSGRVAPPVAPELHRSRGTEGSNPPVDELMTMQGVYRKWVGTLPPSLEASPRWTRFGQSANSIYRSLMACSCRTVSSATEITQTTPRRLRVFCGCTERSIFRLRGCHEYNLSSFSEGEFLS
jgi:hypothetical protein